MDTHVLPFDVLQCRMRTARQKKRAQKEDFDKQLIQLDKQESALWQTKKHLPMLPLEEPYQRGWKRFFVLRKDVKASDEAAFYEGLLEKVNTIHYSPDKTFKIKRRAKGKKVYHIRPQYLREFTCYSWADIKPKLTAAELSCFHTELRWREHHTRAEIVYVVTDPWRYELKIMPHIITEVRMVDNVLEQEMAELDRYIKTHHLRHKMGRLTNGRKNTYNHKRGLKLWEESPYKNKAKHTIQYASED